MHNSLFILVACKQAIMIRGGSTRLTSSNRGLLKLLRNQSSSYKQPLTCFVLFCFEGNPFIIKTKKRAVLPLAIKASLYRVISRNRWEQKLCQWLKEDHHRIYD